MFKNFSLIIILLLCFSQKTHGQIIMDQECFLENRGRVTNRIVEDHYGFIWWARGDGFYRYDGKEIAFINPSIDSKDISFYAAANLTPLENGDYWFASREEGALFYNTEKDSFYHTRAIFNGDSLVYIYNRDISIVPDKGIFLAGNKGVWHFDENMNFIQRIEPASVHDEPEVWYANEIRKTLYDSKRNILWLAGKIGLLSYHFDNKKLERHLPPFINTERALNFFLVNDMHLEDDIFTLTTWGGGLQTYNIESGEWQQFIFPDEKHIDYRSGNTQLGLTRDGRFFTAHEIREGASWKTGEDFLSIPKIDEKTLERGVGSYVDRLGYLWIGHWRKVCKYIVRDEPPVAKSSQIYVNKIEVDSATQFQRMHRWDNQKLFLGKEPSSISFVFRAIHPLSYDSIFYEYRMEGLDESWKENGKNEKAIFSNLKNGDYYFQARYFDSISKQYIYTGKVFIKIKEENLFSQNVVYTLLGLVLLSFLGFLYYRHLTEKRRMKAIQKYETQLREVQDAALRSQMNPHFLFNSLNSIRYFIVTNDNEKAAGYLTKFSRLIRMILENSKKKLVPLEEEITLLELYVKMEQIRFENKFDYEVKIDEQVFPNKIMIPPMLIQPYIENAIIHGINPKEGRGKITLTFKNESPFLLIEIEDDGIGRQRSLQLKRESVFKKKSLGLSITKARLELVDTLEHKANMKIEDLVDEKGSGIGTKVVLQLPMR